MKSNRQTLVFSVLVIFLLIGLQSINNVDKKYRNQVSEEAKEDKSETSFTRIIKNPQNSISSIIPLYKSGDLITHNRPEKKTFKKINSASKTVKSKTKNFSKDNSTTKKRDNLTGDRPVLDVSYSDIGFQRYVELIEKKGRLFLLLDNAGKLELGPAITLNESKILKHSNDMSRLAVSRPHMISDNMIKENIANIDIPKTALAESVVLIFHKPFDSVLWDTIEDTLDKVKVSMSEVSQVTGEYMYKNKRIMLVFKNAILKKNGQIIPLKSSMTVSL